MRTRVTDILGRAYIFNGSWEDLEPKLVAGDLVEYTTGKIALNTNHIVTVEELT